MARIAKAFSADFVKTFEDKFFSMHPSVKTDGVLNRKQVVATMRVLGTDEYPMWLLQEKNRTGRGVYKLGTYTPPAPKAVKVKANKPTKGKVGPSVNSQRWASGKAPLKTATPKAVKGDSNPAAFDDSVEFEDVVNLRNEFGLGEFRNTLD